MSFLWLFFGALLGSLSTPPRPGVAGVIIGAIAGMIVLPFIGAVLGLLGGKWRQTLAGGLIGLAVGVLAGLVKGEMVAPAANMGLLCGGLIGATFFSFFSHFRQVIKKLAASSPWSAVSE